MLAALSVGDHTIHVSYSGDASFNGADPSSADLTQVVGRAPTLIDILTTISIYGSDQTVEVRKAVVNALFIQNNASALVTLARGEKNIEMKKDIVQKLSNMKSKEATDYLMELLK